MEGGINYAVIAPTLAVNSIIIYNPAREAVTAVQFIKFACHL